MMFGKLEGKKSGTTKFVLHIVLHDKMDVYDKQLFLIFHEFTAINNGDYKSGACRTAPRIMSFFLIRNKLQRRMQCLRLSVLLILGNHNYGHIAQR